VKHPSSVRHGRTDCLGILEVAPVHLELGLDVRRQVVEMTPVVATIVPHQHAHPVSVTNQSFG
jgi:hypothetical protein